MKILLLGDSIRMFYENEVRSLLGGEYEVFSPGENCRFSSYLLNSLRFWLNDIPTPDVIHLNAGLWDSAILYPEDGCFTPVDQYVSNMKKVFRELKKTGAKLIFATTTPVSDKKESLPGPMPPAHKNEDIKKYNKAILEAFENEDILINDLFWAMYEKRESLICDDMIHPNDDGIRLLGRKVADVIKSLGDYENKTKMSKTAIAVQNEKTIQ